MEDWRADTGRGFAGSDLENIPGRGARMAGACYSAASAVLHSLTAWYSEDDKVPFFPIWNDLPNLLSPSGELRFILRDMRRSRKCPTRKSHGRNRRCER